MKFGRFGEANLAALIGSSIASITGLIAVGIAPAMIEHNPRLILAHPTIGLCCFVIGGAFGWLAGGLLGARLARRGSMQEGYITGGLIGGFIPFAVFVFLGWYLWTH